MCGVSGDGGGGGVYVRVCVCACVREKIPCTSSAACIVARSVT